MPWEFVLPDVLVWEDSCNVYAVVGSEGVLVVNAGTGQWLDHLHELPKKPVALACTHFFRDHSAGAIKAARAGIPIYVPEGEREIFADPEQHFRQCDTYLIYENYRDLFAPIDPIPVTGVLRDYDQLRLAGLDISVLPLPGVTITQVGLVIKRPDLGLVVFCGEAIHSPGRMARIAPLQYNYNDLRGAVNAYSAAKELRKLGPSALLPSLGVPILRDCDMALEQLQGSLRALCLGRPEEMATLNLLESAPLHEVTKHVWMSTECFSYSWFIISESGKALAIDYGYNIIGSMLTAPSTAKPYRRRALLHSLEGLRRQFGINRVDVVLLSHYHDDHVCGVPLLQRIYNTQCWVVETFADLVAHPEAHCFPCNWPQPIRVDRRLPLDQSVQWEEYTFRFASMNGHTRFEVAIDFEADGKRFAHTGDQYFFQKGKGDWVNDSVQQNHVYRNGALLDGYAKSAAHLRQWRPDILLTGHQRALYTDGAFFNLLDSWADHYESSHRRAMILGDDEVHFNLDGWGGWIWPYRLHLPEVGPVQVQVTVRNPLPRAALLEVQLVGPQGWVGSAASLPAEARAEVSCELQITPTGTCRRQPFVVELFADGRSYGQVAEALVTVGGPEF